MATILTATTRFFAVRSIRLSVLTALTIALLSLLGWQSSQFIRSLNDRSPVAVTEAVNTSYENKPEKSDSALIHLFGAKDSATDLRAQVLEKLPESNLNLQVSAIFFMARAEQSSVILEDGDRTLMLKPGEEVRPGIVVQVIESHRITLKRNGKFEQVSFKGFGEIPAGNSMNAPPLDSQEIGASSFKSQKNDSEVIAQTSVEVSTAMPTATGQSQPTAYQQYIQRKLAQTK